jgi:hypothetical protein
MMKNKPTGNAGGAAPPLWILFASRHSRPELGNRCFWAAYGRLDLAQEQRDQANNEAEDGVRPNGRDFFEDGYGYWLLEATVRS